MRCEVATSDPKHRAKPLECVVIRLTMSYEGDPHDIVPLLLPPLCRLRFMTTDHRNEPSMNQGPYRQSDGKANPTSKPSCQRQAAEARYASLARAIFALLQSNLD